MEMFGVRENLQTSAYGQAVLQHVRETCCV